MMAFRISILNSCRHAAFVLFIGGFLAGCGHLVTGYSSIPYLDGLPRLTDSSVRTGIPKAPIDYPGAKVTVNLWNDMFTSAPEAAAFNRKEPGDYIMLLQVTPQDSNVTLEPMAIRLIVDGVSHAVTSYSGSETDMRVDPPRGRKRVFSSWTGRIGDTNPAIAAHPMALTEGCFYTLSLHFKTEKPSPDREIAFNLSAALRLPHGIVPEMIRFQKVQWQEMHQ